MPKPEPLRGRPPLPNSERADCQIQLRVTRKRKAAYVRAANRKKQTLAAWAFDALDRHTYSRDEAIERAKQWMRDEYGEPKDMLLLRCDEYHAKLGLLVDFLWTLFPEHALAEPPPPASPDPTRCGCRKCNPDAWWMVVCDSCGNKRCPHATDHRHDCTNSNAPGQDGSAFDHLESTTP